MSDAMHMPPSDIMAEMGVLGSMMLSADALRYALDNLIPTDFYKLAHQEIFEAIGACAREAGAADIVLLRKELVRRGQLEKCGGVGYLASIMQDVPTSASIEYYSELVREAAIRRRVLGVAREAQIQAANEAVPLDQLAARLKECMDLIEERTAREPPSIADAFDEAERQLEARARGEEALLQTELPGGFDSVLRGLVPGCLTMISARPGMGKTSLILNILVNCSVKRGIPSLFFSAETPAFQIAKDLARIVAAVDYTDMGRGAFRASNWERWRQAREQLQASPLVVDDTSSIYVEDLRARAVASDAQLVCVDFLQLLRTRVRGERHAQVEHITKELKRLARDKGVPVVAASQLQRYSRERAQMDKWSSAIEEVAGQMIRIGRKPLAEGETEGARALRWLEVYKNRHGPKGVRQVMFDMRYLKFEEVGDEDERDDSGSGEGGAPVADNAAGVSRRSDTRGGAVGEPRAAAADGSQRATTPAGATAVSDDLDGAIDVPEGEIPF